MKKLNLFIITVISAFYCNAQSDSLYNQIGFSYHGFGDNDAFHLSALAGAASYSGSSFYGYQFDFVHPINRVLSLETGIGYRHHELTMHPNLPPNLDDTGKPVSCDIVVIPVTMRVSFAKYLFINSGVFLDTTVGKSGNIADQNGIGLNLGIGLKYDFKFGLGTQANPYTSIHSLLSISNENYPERVSEGGIKLGVTYRVK